MKEWKGRSWRSREERGRGVEKEEVTAGVEKDELVIGGGECE